MESLRVGHNWATKQLLQLEIYPSLVRGFHDGWTILNFLKFIFNWGIIALQCCVGFCHTTMWISHKYIYISPSFWTSHWLSVLHMEMYICQYYPLNWSHLLFPTLLLCPQVCSLCLHLYSCPANRFIGTISIFFFFMLKYAFLWGKYTEIIIS